MKRSSAWKFGDLLRLLVGLFQRSPDADIDDEPTELQKLPSAVAIAPRPAAPPSATETLAAAETPAEGIKVPAEPEPEPEVLPADPEPEPEPVESGRQWHDLRGEPRPESRGRSKGRRDWSKIKGITIHQTAVDFGTNPRRLINVPVHGATLRDGSIVLLQSPTAYMWHGHSFNKRDIGIEVSCRAAGVWDDPATAVNEGKWTLWLPKSIREKIAAGKTTEAENVSEATDTQLEATKELIRYYVDLVASHGGKIEFIHAHRQSSKSRTSDPGERIWKAVGKWAQEELGLSAGPPGWSAGGYPLPDVWTDEPNGVRYNWRIDRRIEPDKDDA